MTEPLAIGVKEIVRGVRRWRFWLTYGWRDVHKTYVATVFGGFVITMQTAVHVGVLNVIFGASIGAAHPDYLAYLALGLPLFSFIAGGINADQGIFRRNVAILKNIPFPVFAFVMRGYFRNIVHLGYALVPFATLAVLGIIHIPISGLAAAPGIVLLLGIGAVTTCFFSLFSLYFVNLSAVFSALTRLLFLATPVLWIAEDRHGLRRMISQYNPVYHVLTTVREAALAHPVSWVSYAVALGWFVIMGVACIVFLAHVRKYLILKM